MSARRRRRVSLSAFVLIATIALAGCGLIDRSDGPAAGAGRRTVTLVEPDGGPRYFAKFKGGLPSDPAYFPLGVWFESVGTAQDVQLDRAAGINLYVALSANSDPALVQEAGMRFFGQVNEWRSQRTRAGSAMAGWVLADEIDMNEGPLAGPRTLSKILKRLPADDGRIRYNNYGKGITFWETNEQAARFVNGFQDVVSADTYWFTDNAICQASEGGAMLAYGKPLSEPDCRLAANYGKTVSRVRSLVKPAGSKPVWNFVEVGHPFTDAASHTITPAQIRAATWSGLINGARGVVYFNHSFGGSSQTQHVLRDPAYAQTRAAVTALNAQITSLARVLNASSVNGLVTTTGKTDVLAKWSGGHFYVFAGSTTNGAQSVAFSLPCVGDARVEVLGEGRRIAVKDGRFSDRFADGDAVHLYRVDGGGRCGL